MHVVTEAKKLRKLISKPSFKGSSVINENVQLVEMGKENLMLNRPVGSGFTVLELSKLHMYDFYYNYIKRKYPGLKSQLAYTDTDSLLMEIKTEDLYADMINDPYWFDFSQYPPNAACFQKLGLCKETIEELQNTNRMVYGKMKDETNSMPVLRYVCLKCKSYGIQIQGKCKDCEGIRACVVF